MIIYAMLAVVLWPSGPRDGVRSGAIGGGAANWATDRGASGGAAASGTAARARRGLRPSCQVVLGIAMACMLIQML
jgi:hypothetical protein